MAKLIRPNGEKEFIFPKDGVKFSKQEIKELFGDGEHFTYFDISSSDIMVVDLFWEHLDYNKIASNILDYRAEEFKAKVNKIEVHGCALICDRKEFP